MSDPGAFSTTQNYGTTDSKPLWSGMASKYLHVTDFKRFFYDVHLSDKNLMKFWKCIDTHATSERLWIPLVYRL